MLLVLWHDANGHWREAHETLTDWVRQLLLVVKRGLPDRQAIAVGDGSYDQAGANGLPVVVQEIHYDRDGGPALGHETGR